MVTTDIMVFTKSPKRWFDLDAERHALSANTHEATRTPDSKAVTKGGEIGPRIKVTQPAAHPAGAPLLDWWEIPETDNTWQPEGEPSMTARYLIGDVLEVAPTLEPGSVDLIVSSPPFLAVRSYLPADHPDKGKEGGQQSTPGGYIDWLIGVVEALAPCLAEHGSLVFELGDTYAGSGGAGGDYNADGFREGQPRWDGSERRNAVDKPVTGRRNGGWDSGGAGWPRAKSKSLIPELFRLALTYGINPLTGRTTPRWILRNVITWCRPNPTPGALGDKVRPATSDIAVFTKSGRRWFDLDAERTPVVVEQNYERDPTSKAGSRAGTVGKGPRFDRAISTGGAPLLDWWELPPEQPTPPSRSHARTAKGVESVPRSGKSADRGGNWSSMAELHETAEAPPLDFWVLPPGGYSGAHYAVWPPELVRRLINLMCPQRVCRTCGEPSRRIVETERHIGPSVDDADRRRLDDAREIGTAWLKNPTERSYMTSRRSGVGTDRTTLGWSDCGHDNWRDGLVLDPFCGSGTTLAVASGMGRESIGIDLDDRNLVLARERIGMFLEDG